MDLEKLAWELYRICDRIDMVCDNNYGIGPLTMEAAVLDNTVGGILYSYNLMIECPDPLTELIYARKRKKELCKLIEYMNSTHE